MSDSGTGPTDLERFVQAQESGSSYAQALAELRRGRKTSHWIWYVFPQVAGLGSSPMSQRFALDGLEEARAYAAHPVLGLRLREAAQAMLEAGGSGTAEEVLGGIDALKLRSSMTLFHLAVPEEPVFLAVLDRFYAGEPTRRPRAGSSR